MDCVLPFRRNPNLAEWPAEEFHGFHRRWPIHAGEARVLEVSDRSFPSILRFQDQLLIQRNNGAVWISVADHQCHGDL